MKHNTAKLNFPLLQYIAIKLMGNLSQQTTISNATKDGDKSDVPFCVLHLFRAQPF